MSSFVSANAHRPALASLMFSSCSVLVYDYLLTLDQEIEFVWRRQFTFGSILFIFNRYSPFIEAFVSLHNQLFVLTPEQCEVFEYTLAWFIVFGVLVAELILMVRTYAIWSLSRRILYILIATGIFAAVPGIIATQLELQSMQYGSSTVPGITIGCFLISTPSPIIVVAFLSALVSETVIFVLTVIKAVSHLRRSRAPMVVNLYRDGLLFYFYCLIITLLNILLTVLGPSVYRNWLATPQHVIHSVCCTRVLFFIFRSSKKKDETVSTSNPSTSVSTQLFTSIFGVSGRIQQEEDIPMTDFTPTIQNAHDGPVDDSFAENRRGGDEEQQLPHSTNPFFATDSAAPFYRSL